MTSVSTFVLYVPMGSQTTMTEIDSKGNRLFVTP
jgi:hypothetical protein